MTQEHDVSAMDEGAVPAVEAPAVPAPEKEDARAAGAASANGPQWVPQPLKDGWAWCNAQGEKLRKVSITATPAFIINNSSNILATSHVLTEGMMFKSGMKGAKLIDDPSNPINWVKQPLQKIWADIYTKSAARGGSIKDLFKGNPLKNLHETFFDTTAATARELDLQLAEKAGKALPKTAEELIAEAAKGGAVVTAEKELEFAKVAKKAREISLGNPWQTRTTGMGLLIWTLSAFIPEKKESDEQIEHMAKERALHPLRYIGERLKQAVWVPEWNVHKREMLGLGYLAIGTLSMMGSWRNRGELCKGISKEVIASFEQGEKLSENISKDAVKKMELMKKAKDHGYSLPQGYTFNLGYFFTSVVSFAAGLPLLFALDEKRAYSTYGSLSMFRIPFLFSSIGSKMQKKEMGWQYYAASKVTFQVEDALFSLIGGATKIVKPDGTIEIVDHEALKKKALHEATVEKVEKKQEKLLHQLSKEQAINDNLKSSNDNDTQPVNKIVKVDSRVKALPGHVAAHEQLAEMAQA